MSIPPSQMLYVFIVIWRLGTTFGGDCCIQSGGQIYWRAGMDYQSYVWIATFIHTNISPFVSTKDVVWRLWLPTLTGSKTYRMASLPKFSSPTHLWRGSLQVEHVSASLYGTSLRLFGYILPWQRLPRTMRRDAGTYISQEYSKWTKLFHRQAYDSSPNYIATGC